MSVVLQVQTITTLDGLDRLYREWSALWALDPSATPFQSPAWLVPWCRHVGKGELMVFAAGSWSEGENDIDANSRRLTAAGDWHLGSRGGQHSRTEPTDPANGRLLAVVPLYIYAQPDGGPRDVFPLGIATTDYLDGTFAPGVEAAVMNAAFERLDANRYRWDRCDWPQIRDGSPLLDAPAPAGWADDRGDGEPCPVLPLPDSVDGLAGVVPERTLYNLRYARRRAAKLDDARVEAADERNWAEWYDALLALHAARWAGRGETGVLAGDGVRAAHRASIPALLAAGALRMYGLRVGGAPAAVFYGLCDGPAVPPDRRRVYYYLGGFDAAFDKISPGALLVGHAIDEAVRDGFAAFDFLRGREGYKYAWGAADAPTRRRTLRHDRGEPERAAP